MNILEARRRVLGGEVYKKIAEGNPVSVRSLARMRPGLSVMGKSTQKTTTGAQLIPFEVGQQIVSRNGYVKGTITENGIQIEASDGADNSNNSDLYMVGSFNSSNEKGYREVDTLPAGKYKLSCSDQDYRLYVVVWRNGASVIIGDSLNENTQRFTVEDGDKFRIFIRSAYSGITGTKNVKFIVEKEDNNIDWEIFTGVKPSPSPDYPQEISSAGDDGSIQVDITGANICPETQKVNINIEETGNMSHYGYSGLIPVVPGEKYSINTSMIVKYFDESKELVRSKQESIITPNENEKYIKLRTVSNIVSLGDDFKIMINAGESILPYEPYKQPQSLTVQTPNGLPGIPVTSGGNYTDENGQQWVCDEIDFKRGKYVKRIDRKTFNATDVKRYANSEQYGPYVVLNTLGKYTNSEVSIMSDKFIPVSFEKRTKYINAFRIYVDDKGFCNLRFPVGTVISNLYEAKNLVNDISPKCIVVLKNPIETDLSQEQLSAYANLHTNRPTTIVSATDDAGIKLTYKTKKSLEVT